MANKLKLPPCTHLINGQPFPMLGLGTYQSGPDKVYDIVKKALEDGYRHIDCAAFYQNEKEIGRAVEEVIAGGNITREDIFITSKLWCTAHRPELVEKACEKTLQDLRLKYIDLYLIHWPSAFKPGEDLLPRGADGLFDMDDVDFMDTYKAMEGLVRAGKTKSIGISNFNSEQVERVMKESEIKPAVNQVECHPYLQQHSLTKECAQHNIQLVGYCPLGAPGRDGNMCSVLKDQTIRDIAEKRGRTPAQVTLRFLVQLGVVPIPKTVTPERLTENLNIFDFELTVEEMRELKKLDRNDRIVTFDGAKNCKYYPFN